ncbi:MAG: DUF4426 domain-containing protein [Wenzhouxiangella sp.]|jgi:hypothetical protein|nr:DUF4426 domain-containing protein [Wenzhouxiangella sp.]
MTSGSAFRSASLGAALALLLLASPALGQQAEDIGDYLIHYNTFNTNRLTPDVARAYGIQRSGNRAMLNIAVIRKGDGVGTGTATRAQVEASAVNLVGQQREFEMTEIRDQDAIYYIGTFRITNEERLNFRVRVLPEGSRRVHEFSFWQQFYAD